MMEDIRQYLLSVIICAIICAVAMHIVGKNGMVSSVLKLLTGLFILYTVLSPWTEIEFSDFTSYFSGVKADAASAVNEGKEYATDSMASIIKHQTEAYILDKASSLDLDITVEVSVNNEELPSPESVKISGNASPYKKQQLTQIVLDQLGISKENLSWT